MSDKQTPLSRPDGRQHELLSLIESACDTGRLELNRQESKFLQELVTLDKLSQEQIDALCKIMDRIAPA